MSNNVVKLNHLKNRSSGKKNGEIRLVMSGSGRSICYEDIAKIVGLDPNEQNMRDFIEQNITDNKK